MLQLLCQFNLVKDGFRIIFAQFDMTLTLFLQTDHLTTLNIATKMEIAGCKTFGIDLMVKCLANKDS